MELKHENRPSEIPAGVDVRMEGPFVVGLSYYAKRRDGKIVKCSIEFGDGKRPTREEVSEQIAEFKKDMATDGFEPLTKAEFWNYRCMALFGEVLPMPGALEWEAVV